MDSHVAISGDSFLVKQFHDFYREVIRLRGTVETGTWTFGKEALPEEGDRRPAMNTIWQYLLSLLERQALHAGQHGGEYGAMFYREAQYVMAALADELFLHLPWEGRATWRDNLLEAKLFQSHVAGQRLFEKLERVLQERDPVYAEIAVIYLMALALGFRGKYRDCDDGGQLQLYRQQLFMFIFRRHPELLSDTKRLFPDAYDHTLTEGHVTTLPDAWKWLAILGLLVVLWLGISHGVWRQLTDELFAKAQAIYETKVQR
jgi:type VI secretion system protein ImpK